MLQCQFRPDKLHRHSRLWRHRICLQRAVQIRPDVDHSAANPIMQMCCDIGRRWRWFESRGGSSWIIGASNSAERITITHVWLVLPLALSFALLCMTPLKEGDLWWHIKLGELIVNARRIPDMDTFSFTAAGMPYFFSYSWLSDVLFYLLERVGGLSALVLCQAVVGMSVAGLLLRENLARGASAPRAAAIALFGWVGVSPYISTRPQIFSILLFALFAWVLSAYAHGRGNRLWLLPPLMLAWVNLHGGWVMGIVLLVLYAFGLTMEKTVGEKSGPQLRPLFVWGTITLGMVLLNPEGLQIYRNLFAVGGNAIIQQYVSEWQPMVITNPLSWPLFGMLTLWIFGLAYSQKRPRFHEIALVLVFSCSSSALPAHGTIFLHPCHPRDGRTARRAELRSHSINGRKTGSGYFADPGQSCNQPTTTYNDGFRRNREFSTSTSGIKRASRIQPDQLILSIGFYRGVG